MPEAEFQACRGGFWASRLATFGKSWRKLGAAYCGWTQSMSTTWKPGQTIVCWDLQGKHQKSGFLRWCRISSIHGMRPFRSICKSCLLPGGSAVSARKARELSRISMLGTCSFARAKGCRTDSPSRPDCSCSPRRCRSKAGNSCVSRDSDSRTFASEERGAQDAAKKARGTCFLSKTAFAKTVAEFFTK